MIIKPYVSSTCPICLKICLSDVILCDLCNTWMHPKCLKMSIRQFKSLANSNTPYFCQRCITKSLSFCTITNIQFSRHFLAINHNDKVCTKCDKAIDRSNMIYCRHNKHHIHASCVTDQTINHNDNSTLKSNNVWCCSECLNLPFITISDTKDLLADMG